jgi:hypothetical protein
MKSGLVADIALESVAMKRHKLPPLLLAAFATAAVLTVPGFAATSESVQTRIAVAPPAPLAETIPPGPNFSAYWLPGYWQWNGRDYVWTGGHWEQSRPGMAYQQTYWTNHDGYWEFHPGGWVTLDDAPPVTSSSSQIVTMEPPPPQVEVIPVAPGPSYVWISGVWIWGGSHYAWRPGYWSGVRVGYTWAPDHWVRHGGGWRFTGGYWHHHR